ncbi:MAG: acylphosphatase [Candidatus Omnitrophica bacterium]|nr:acylphosphatase [Candidatus Omnitrophota bacterium]MBU4589839.1 acylphosphatase [Candidatus Omnitrophota bacterium]
MSHKRLHVFYFGYVQGVGFRYTVRRIASGLGLVGWVSNLPDGRVEVMCEGDETKLKKFLNNIKTEFADRYIRDTQVSWDKPTREFKQFTITF